MLCLSLKTAACRFCLRFFVFNDTYEVRKKGVIQINKKGQIKNARELKKLHLPSFIPVLMRNQMLLPSSGFSL